MIELDKLTGRLERQLVKAFEGDDSAWDEIKKILADVDYNHADAQMAATFLGMVAPFLPEVQDNPPGTPGQADLAIRGLEDLISQVPPPPGQLVDDDNYRYPQLEDAVRFITEQRIMTEDEISRLTTATTYDTFSAPGINSKTTLRRLQDIVADAVGRGDTLSQFRDEARQVVSLEKHEEETLYRTKTKQAYTSGLERTLEQPAVRKRFPAVRYSATPDNRTRDHHWDLDGVIVYLDTPAYEVIRDVLREYNCRCNAVPVTQRQIDAMGGGISEIKDLPASVKLHFGL